MPTLVEKMLDIADGLILDDPLSSAARRRAVSTAYYAVFHTLQRICADEMLESEPRTSAEYERVYRALAHGALKAAFQSAKPLRDRETLRKIGEWTIELQSERIRADYLPPVKNVFTRSRSETLVAQARRAVEELEALRDDDRRFLAAYLLFRDPKGQREPS